MNARADPRRLDRDTGVSTWRSSGRAAQKRIVIVRRMMGDKQPIKNFEHILNIASRHISMFNVI